MNIIGIRLLLFFVVILQFNFSAHSYTVVINDRSSYGVAEIVERVLPYSSIPQDAKVLVRSSSDVTVIRTNQRSEDILFEYNKAFDQEIQSGPFAAIDILMLVAQSIAHFSNESDIYFLAEVLAFESVSRQEILFYSEKIRSQEIPWLDEKKVEQLIEEHRLSRMYFLNPEESFYDAPIMEEPVQPPLAPNDGEGPGSGGDSYEDPVIEMSPVIVSEEEPNNSVVKVYYATNRKKYPHVSEDPSEWSDPNDYYSGLRESGETINYGYTTVNIPKIHEKGNMERPSVVRLEFWNPPVENPDKHIMLTKIQELDKDEFFDNLKVESETAKTAFVFVHGFNVSFDGAARVTAQLSFDSEFTGTPILFSWPSDGTLLNPTSYVSDSTDAADGAYRLKEFLFQLVEEGGYEVINLVAHSMGNLAMTSALSLFEREWSHRLEELHANKIKPFKDLVMYAPDVDVGIFSANKQYIREVVDHASIYASDNDKAITFSSSIRPGAPRLGGYIVDINESDFCRKGLMYSTEGFDSIDATDVNLGMFSPLNHSYYSEYNFVSDFGKLMSTDTSMQNPENRGLGQQIRHKYDGHNYDFWGFIPCD